MENHELPLTDSPIQGTSEDVLGRADAAHRLARCIREADATKGLVTAIFGPWGSGKSSFINLMKEEFRADQKLTVIDFNPWMFSGSQQLVEFFFKEVAAELHQNPKDKVFRGIADGFSKYGDLLSPMSLIPGYGAFLGPLAKAAKDGGKAYLNRKNSISTLRAEITKKLAGLEDRSVVIVIDDVDRLSTDEIKDVFKLVRLTASFPNVVYLLAFDRARVEQALTVDGTNVSGRAYLEKIIQLGFDLPVIPAGIIRSEVFVGLDRVLADVPGLRFNQTRWADVYFGIVEPLLRNMRDVVRFSISIRPTLDIIGGEIETVDLIALEAIRVFRPDLFTWLQGNRALLTKASVGNSRDASQQKGKIDALLAENKDENNAKCINGLFELVFPTVQAYTKNVRYDPMSSFQWRRDHRVACRDFLDLYFDNAVPAGLVSFRQSERAFELMEDRKSFGEYLDSLPPEEFEDAVSGLRVYEGRFSARTVVPASVELLRKMGSIPQRKSRGMFDFMTPDLAVSGTVSIMFRTLKQEEERETAVKEILTDLMPYSSRLVLIELVGHIEGKGEGLVSEDFAKELEDAFVQQVMSASSPVPAEECCLLHVYWFVSNRLGDGYSAPEFTDPAEIYALFRSSHTVARSQALGSSRVKEEDRLAWDGLVRVFGSEEAVRKAADVLRRENADSQLMELVDRYLAGWRPKDTWAKDQGY